MAESGFSVRLSEFIDQILASADKNADELIRLDLGMPQVSLQEVLENEFLRDFAALGESLPILGMGDLRSRLAANLNFGIAPEWSENDICITNGSVAGLYFSLKSILSPSDIVLVPKPSWPKYDDLVLASGGIPASYQLSLDSEHMFAGLERKLSSSAMKIRAVIVNTPHNPTGMLLERSQFSRLVAFAENCGAYIFCDEAYHQVILSSDAPPLRPIKSDLVYYFRTFSKYYMAPGIRVGYTFGGANIRQAAAHHHLAVGGVDKLAQAAALRLLDRRPAIFEDALARYKSAARLACNICLKYPSLVKARMPRGTFFALIRFADPSLITAFCNRLLRHYDTLVLPGGLFGGTENGYIRVSLTEKPDKLALGLENLDRCLRDFSHERKIFRRISDE